MLFVEPQSPNKYPLTHSRSNAREGTYFWKPTFFKVWSRGRHPEDVPGNMYLWRRVTFFDAENKKRVLAISTHIKTANNVVENGYF